MIKTHEKAIAVQDRRFNAGKRGIAKAVRRFMRREPELAAKVKQGITVKS